ncbi:hypothetical protein CEH05_14345 [Halobacillus halophilus]|uniref:Uncharacterized protein n=1 Tax=Halobacillus halophilus (strain ATCC 35676 / DSM 2266 / JCM 20832 / KCTC 3685 / LMG 17431 / NBRC 102448 / NCIMB 2269) TaxID=866895 RepID=I0JQ18_HALH3|nr:hypothetical protein [Halobacillus halophilus]ASF40257.1 hypothetical protein CEH05_14345 [Halobacillus halophilus]CCG46238.1 hypothetical protein HBHAL_3896 [Halobacillus halophilus DSM 2266]
MALQLPDSTPRSILKTDRLKSIYKNQGKCVVVYTRELTFRGILEQIRPEFFLIIAGDTIYELDLKELIEIKQN